MPSRYTSIITNEKCTFEDFAWRCARAFGPFTMQRDESLEAPIDLNPKCSYQFSKERVEELQKELDDLEKTSIKEWKDRKNRELSSEKIRLQRLVVTNKANKERYERMLFKVKSWEPPTNDHKPLKDLMISQIEQTIKYDCSNFYYTKRIAQIEKDQEMYSLEDEISSVKKELVQAKVDYENDMKANERSANWIQGLIDAIGLPPQGVKNAK